VVLVILIFTVISRIEGEQNAHRERCEKVNALPLVADGKELCLSKEALR
jgi:hypothetical protein